MADLTLGVRITADGRAFVDGVQATEKALNDLNATAERTGQRVERGLKPATDAATGMGVAVRESLRDVNDAAQRTGRTVGQSMQPATQAITGLGVSMRGLAALGGVALGVEGIRQAAGAYIGAADAVTALSSRLRVATGDATSAATAQARLYEIAQRSKVSFLDLGATFAQLTRSTAELGVSQERLLGVTEAVSQAVALSGGSSASAQAAMIQLSQGLASGALRSEELNSVMEQTPRLALAIAQGLGVTTGQLRQMGAEGKLTADAILDAMDRSAKGIAREFEQLAPTVDRAWTKFKNSATTTAAAVDTAAGFTRSLAEAIDGIASAIDRNRAKFEAFGGILKFWRDNMFAPTAIPNWLEKSFGDPAAIAGRIQSMRELNAAIDEQRKKLADNEAANKQSGGYAPFGLKPAPRDVDGPRAAIAALEAQRAKLNADAARQFTEGTSSEADRVLARAQASYHGAESVGKATAGLKTREAIYREHTERMAGLARAFGREMEVAQANGDKGAVARLQGELKASYAAVEKDRDEALKNLNKPPAGAGRATKSAQEEVDRLAAQQRKRATDDIRADLADREDAERDAIATIKALGASGVMNAEQQARATLETRRAFIAEYQRLREAEVGVAMQAFGNARSGSEREEAAAGVDRANAAVREAARERVRIEREGMAEIEAAVRAEQNARTQSQAAIIKASQSSAQAARDEAEARRIAAVDGIEIEDARSRILLTNARTELAWLEETQGAREDELATRRQALGLMEQEQAARREVRVRDAMARREQADDDAFAKAMEKQKERQEKNADELSRSLTDALYRGFENGKGFWQNFRDTLKASFGTMILRPIIEPIMKPIANFASKGIEQLLGGLLGVAGGGTTSAAPIEQRTFPGGIGANLGADWMTEPRAEGGPVHAGQDYWVGERGPELLRMTNSGSAVIAPASIANQRDAGRSVVVTIPQTFYITAGIDAAQAVDIMRRGKDEAIGEVSERIKRNDLAFR